jgi:hypothetical protein
MFSRTSIKNTQPAPPPPPDTIIVDKHLTKTQQNEISLPLSSSSSSSNKGMGDKRASRYLSNDITRTGGNEKVQSGVPKSLGEVLRSAPLRNKFRVFLRKYKASESLAFYETIELYQAIQDPKWRSRAAEGIISKFIDASAVFEVNISSSVRQRLLQTTKWENSSFDDAKAEAYDLMKTNFFANFISNEFLRAGD